MPGIDQGLTSGGSSRVIVRSHAACASIDGSSNSDASSSFHCVLNAAGTITRTLAVAFLPTTSRTITPASTVFPNPTSSPISTRVVAWRKTARAGSSW